MLRSWQVSYIGFLTCEVQAIVDGKNKWKSMGLLLPEEIMNQNQDQIPAGTAEIRATTEDLKYAEVVPPLLLFNYPIWPIQKTDGSQRMTVDYHKHDQEVTLMATVPDVVSLCRCMNTYPVT